MNGPIKHVFHVWDHNAFYQGLLHPHIMLARLVVCSIVFVLQVIIIVIPQL